MSTSTDGQLHFGIVFEEGFTFPWDVEEGHEGDIEKWWESVNGYENPNFNPFTEQGNYKQGVGKNDQRIDAWFEHSREWHKNNPTPIELVNYCSGEYPMYLLALSEVGFCASRGYPEKISPNRLFISDEQRSSLVDFCKKYIADEVGEPAWYLTSYWG